MVVCKYSPKLQERRYETLEPSERNTERALVHRHCQEPPNQDRPCWTRPGERGEGPSGRAGAATALSRCGAAAGDCTGTGPGNPFLAAVALEDRGVAGAGTPSPPRTVLAN